MSCYGIDELTNPGERKTVLGTCTVQVHETHTHPPFSIKFFDHDYVYKPLWIANFANETCCKELVYFLYYYFILRWGEYFSVNIVHVSMAPGKDV